MAQSGIHVARRDYNIKLLLTKTKLKNLFRVRKRNSNLFLECAGMIGHILLPRSHHTSEADVWQLVIHKTGSLANVLPFPSIVLYVMIKHKPRMQQPYLVVDPYIILFLITIITPGCWIFQKGALIRAVLDHVTLP